MGLMDLFQQGDITEKIRNAASKRDIPQGGITGALFNGMFPHGAGNVLFGRDPEPMPSFDSPDGVQFMADLASNMMVPSTTKTGGGLMAAIADDWKPKADRIKKLRGNIYNSQQSGAPNHASIQNWNDTIARLEQEVLDSGGQVDPKLVGYEWKSKDGEVYSRWDDGAVSKRISDWENKEVSERSGRDIVHTYFIRGADGTARPFGKQSAIKELVESGVATTPRDAEFLLKKIKEQGR